MGNVDNVTNMTLNNRTGRKKSKIHLYFLLPSLISIIIIMIVPFFFSLYVTLNNVNLLENSGRFTFNGLGNYVNFFKDERALKSIVTTIKFVLGATFVETLLGMGISLFLDRNFRGKRIVRSFLIIPMFMTPVVTGLVWRTFYDPTAGIVNYVLGTLGMGNRHDWLGNTASALRSIILTDVWQWTPYMIILFLASLDSIPDDIYEAAYVAGASESQIIKYIKLPLIVPTIFIAVILRSIDVIKAFDIIYVMTKGGPGLATETVNMYAYTVGFNFFRVGYATTVAFIFTFTITILLSIIITRLIRKTNISM